MRVPQRGEAAPGAVISINLVSLKGGIAESASAPFNDAKFIMNLQPATAEAGFDMRLPPMNAAEMDGVERMIREEWAPAALNFSVTFTIQARGLQLVLCLTQQNGVGFTHAESRRRSGCVPTAAPP